MTNTAWAVILVALLCALTLYAGLFHRPVFLIALFHNVAWAGALALIGTNLVRYETFGAPAWWTLLAGLGAFNLGLFIWNWLVHFRAGRSKPRIESSRGIAILSRRTLVALSLLYGVGFAVYLINIANRFGLATMFADPKSIRGFIGESYLASVPLPARILLYLGPLLFGLLGLRGAIDQPIALRWRLLAMLALGVSMLAMLQRTNIFMAILLLVAAALTQLAPDRNSAVPNAQNVKLLFSRSLSARWKPLLVVVVLVIASGIAFQVVGSALGKSGQQAIQSGSVSSTLADSRLTPVFVYYTGSTVAFLNLTESKDPSWPPAHQNGVDTVGGYNPQTWGAVTFSPILKAIPGSRTFPSVEPFVDVGIQTNVYTWLEPLYRDFRIYGVVIGMLSAGLIVAGAFTTRFRSPAHFWFQAVVVSSVFLAPFITKINDTLFLSELGFVLLLSLKWRSILNLGQSIFKGRAKSRLPRQ